SGQPEPLLLPRTAPALKLLQRVRNEAHRFAITYHRRLRSEALVRSALDDIPGVGVKTRVALLRHFGSVEAVARASAADLAQVHGVGPATAERILAVLSHPALREGRTNAATPADERGGPEPESDASAAPASSGENGADAEGGADAEDGTETAASIVDVE